MAASWPGNRPVKSCTECKQAKLRCDSRAKLPNPCSRCQARGLKCTVDPSFRRTPARKRLEALSREVQELRDKQQSVPDSTLGIGPSSGDSTSGGSLRGASHVPQEHDHEFNLESVQLGETSISNAYVLSAFDIFLKFFYPHLPILGQVSINSVYESSPFLFWTILMVVFSRCLESFGQDLHIELRNAYEDFLRKEAFGVPLSLPNIQALLYLCTWPLPVERQSKDPSWVYCGIAMNSALHMRLHRSGPPPSVRGVGVTPGTASARAETWLGCFHVHTCLAIHLSHPPSITAGPELESIRALLQQIRPANEFSAQIRVQLTAASFSNLLSHGAGNVLDSSLVQLFDDQLTALRTTDLNGCKTMVEYSILTTKLHFYAAVIARSRSPTVARDILVRLGFDASLRIIDLANTWPENVSMGACKLGGPQIQRLQPKNYLRGLAFATIFLLKYFRLNNKAKREEQKLAADHILTSHGIFKMCSKHSEDEYGKAGTLFETLSRQLPTGDDLPGPRPADQLGASLVLDAINTAAEARGERTDISGSSQTPNSGARKDVSENRDLSPEFEGLAPWPPDFALPDDFWNDLMWNDFNFDFS